MSPIQTSITCLLIIQAQVSRAIRTCLTPNGIQCVMKDCTTTIYFRNNLNSSLSNNIYQGTDEDWEELVFGQMLLLREESDRRGKEKG